MVLATKPLIPNLKTEPLNPKPSNLKLQAGATRDGDYAASLRAPRPTVQVDMLGLQYKLVKFWERARSHRCGEAK